MSALTVLFLLALSHVDLSQSLHLNPTVKHQFLSTPSVPKSSRIYNAQGTATPGQFPFQAYIIVDNEYVFGGALITSQHVLTSAVAVIGRREWNVTLGMTDFHATEPYRVQQISTIATWYTSTLVEHSVGIIYLTELVVNEFIRPAILPAFSDDKPEWAGTDAIVSGFGYEGDDGPLSEVLKYAAMTVISNAECHETYAGYDISPIDICATGNGNPCAGDNGAPLFIDMGDSVFKIIGVHTFGWPSCVTGHPAGFMKISGLGVLQWISSVTGLTIEP